MKEVFEELRKFLEEESFDETVDDLMSAFGLEKPDKIIYVEEVLEKLSQLEKKHLTNNQ